MPSPAPPRVCPCGSDMPLAQCCGKLHAGSFAPSAEMLMRSRYSAFVLADPGYLLRTWHPSTRPARLDVDPGTVWRRLEIVDTVDGTLFHRTGTVSFAAHYLRDGEPGVQTEVSRFVRESDQWFYLDAET